MVIRTLGVLVAGVLLVQPAAPVSLLVQGWTGGAMYGCTAQKCSCGEKCHCPHCAKHHGDASSSKEAGAGSPSPSGPSIRSCGGPAQHAGGIFFTVKSLVAPAALPMSAPPSAEPPFSSRRPALVPQRLPDDLFRPPRKRIG